MSKYNFGINGCWIKNDDGSLDYVKEDDYTEEIMAELQKTVDRTRTASRHF